MRRERLVLAWADGVELPLARGALTARVEIERVTVRRRFRPPTVTFVATVRLPEGFAPRVLTFRCPTIPRAVEIATDMLDGAAP